MSHSRELSSPLDARIQPDQCGGPVVDLDGRVLGIAIARVDTTRTLVLPATVVRHVVDELRSRLQNAR